MMEPRPGHYSRGPGALATLPGQTGSWALAYEELKCKKKHDKKVCVERIRAVPEQQMACLKSWKRKLFILQILKMFLIKIEEVLTAVKQH